MNSSEHNPTRKHQQAQINRDPMKTPATETASAHPRDVANAVAKNRKPGEPASGKTGQSDRPPESNPNQPGSDAASTVAESGKSTAKAPPASAFPGGAGPEAAMWLELSDRSDPGSSIAGDKPVSTPSTAFPDDIGVLPKDDE
ncbi:hypothetical protein [Burkholderia sp. L27(2015)]|uniref:hypothetical protein n=1 Tax=Burkholderia sp. L27(2015) TaxID=1641858 RepID=UPI00131ACEA6|nr:hypothetical protein [Burkholderia sp. L27(2015)]